MHWVDAHRHRRRQQQRHGYEHRRQAVHHAAEEKQQQVHGEQEQRLRVEMRGYELRDALRHALNGEKPVGGYITAMIISSVAANIEASLKTPGSCLIFTER